MFDALFGPLIGPECRRALGRGWVLVVRALATAPSLLVVLFVVWIWWFMQKISPDESYGGFLRGGLATLEVMLIIGAIVLGPALVSGTLAGDKMRGTLDMLLASQVTTREIVLARLGGRLALVLVMLMASAPAVAILAGFCGLNLIALAILLVLPLAVAFGGAGIGIGASAVAQRGRDALVVAFVVIGLLMLGAPLLLVWLPASFVTWADALSPARSALALAEHADVRPALRAIATWIGFGIAGVAWGIWRLRRSYLGNDGSRARQRKRRRKMPPIGDRPLLWKELHAERGVEVHRFARWLMTLVVLLIFLGTVALSGIIFTWTWWTHDPSIKDWALYWLSFLSEYVALPLCWLIQWSMGLRAAVGIVSERERSTWDALLVSPLDGREIVGAKICGALYAMRWLLIATLVAWTLQLATGAITPDTYFSLMANTIVVSAFMAAVGVHCSLLTKSTVGAMTLSLTVWLAAAVATQVAAVLLTAVVSLLLLLLWLAFTAWMQGWQNSTGGPGFPISFTTGMAIFRLALYATAGLAIAAYCRSRFDALAGRIPTPRWRVGSRTPVVRPVDATVKPQ